jgi:hypothetical protein
MQWTVSALFLVTSSVIVSGCVTPAPGADQIRLTNNPSDVAACKSVGNIQVSKNDQGLVDSVSAQAQFRNQAVGLGSNVALVTQGFLSIPVVGIAYHCP